MTGSTVLGKNETGRAWWNNELFLVLLFAVLSTWINNAILFYVPLAFVFVKKFLDGSLVGVLKKQPLFLLVPFFFVLFSIVQRDANATVLHAIDAFTWLMVFFIGLSCAFTWKKDDYISALRLTRNVILVLAVISVAMELIGHLSYPYLGSRLYDWAHPIAFSQYSDQRFSSICGHPIVFGNLLIIGICVSVYVSRSKVELWTTCTLFAVLVFFTQSRSAWIILALILVGAIGYFLSRVMKKQWHIVLLIVAVALFAGVALYELGFLGDFIDSVSFRFSQLEDDSSYSFRSGAATYAIEIFQASPLNIPFGFGLGSQKTLLAGTNIGGLNSFGTFDNGFLSLLITNGLFGLFFFVYAVVRITAFGVRNRSKCYAAFIAIVLVMVSEFMFYSALGWKAPMVLLLFSMGLMLVKSSGVSGLKRMPQK